MNEVYFISVTEATEVIQMLAPKEEVDTWINASENDKVRYLNKSGIILNSLHFNGTRRVNHTQPYEFPRYLSGCATLKKPVWKNYQDYQAAQAIRASKLCYSASMGLDDSDFGNNIASESVGSTSISYFEPSNNTEMCMANRNNLDMDTYRFIRDWLIGGY